VRLLSRLFSELADHISASVESDAASECCDLKKGVKSRYAI
jgi:hypothetical protein